MEETSERALIPAAWKKIPLFFRSVFRAESRTGKVFALSLGNALNMVFSIVSGMILARLLTKGELATFRQTMLAYDIAGPILALGIPSALYFFLPTETKRARGVVVDGLVIMIVAGMVYSLFILFGGNHLLARRFSNPDISRLLLYYIPFPLIMLPAGLVSAVLVVRDRVGPLSAYNVISNLLLVLGTIAACLVWSNPGSMIVTRVAISLATGSVAIYLMLRFVRDGDWRPRLDTMKTMVSYSIPLAAASMVGTIQFNLDKVIVSSFFTPEVFAVYSCGAMQIPLIGIVTGAISTVIIPDMRKSIAVGDTGEAAKLFIQASRKSAMILIPAMCFLFVSANEFIRIMFSDKYADATGIFQAYLLRLPLQIMYGGIAFMCFGMNKYVLKITIVSCVLGTAATILFARWFGVSGVPYGVLAVTIVINIFWWIPKLSKQFGVPSWHVYPVLAVIRIFSLSSIAALATLGLKHIFLQQEGVIRAFFSMAFFFPVFFLAIGALFYRDILDELYDILRLQRVNAE